MSDIQSKKKDLLNRGWPGAAYTAALRMENGDGNPIREDLITEKHPFNWLTEGEAESHDWDLIAQKGLDCE